MISNQDEECSIKDMRYITTINMEKMEKTENYDMNIQERLQRNYNTRQKNIEDFNKWKKTRTKNISQGKPNSNHK